MNRVYVIAVIILSFSSITGGQTAAGKSAPVSRSEQTIKALEHTYAEAVMRQDVPALDHLLADDFIATSSRGELRNKGQEIDDIRPNPDYVMKAFDVDEVNVRIFGETAIVTGRSTLKASYKGRDSTSLFRYTRVYARRKGKWQVVAQQLTRIPQQ
ncbi:MAG TPA: nuclear transport factor 2 family protein [Blastocatellia bacterium]|nr:nuclear transport factor 2 family protein [Blastocatellia bacterium]